MFSFYAKVIFFPIKTRRAKKFFRPLVLRNVSKMQCTVWRTLHFGYTIENGDQNSHFKIVEPILLPREYRARRDSVRCQCLLCCGPAGLAGL